MINSSAESKHSSVEYKVARSKQAVFADYIKSYKQVEKANKANSWSSDMHIVIRHYQAATCSQKQSLQIIDNQSTTITTHQLDMDKIAQQCTSAALTRHECGSTTKESNILRLHLNEATAAQDFSIISQVISNIYELEQANLIQHTFVKTQAMCNKISCSHTCNRNAFNVCIKFQTS